MTKKLKKSLLTVLGLFSVCLTTTACSLNYGQNPKGPEYEYEYNQPLRAECDSFMAIDGKLDEEQWKNQTYLEWSSSAGEVKATTIFTNKGLYVGAIAQTDKVIWTARHAYNKNTHFWIQLVKTDVFNYENYAGYDHPGRYLEYKIDAKNTMSFKERQYDANGYCDGNVNEGSTCFSAELFVPWSEFGFSESELDENGQPEAIKALVHFRDPEKGINYPGFTDDGRI